MKVFIYDDKHQQILDEWEFNEECIPTIAGFIQFLAENGVTDRYKSLIIAEKAEVKYEDGEPEVYFE